MSLKHKELAAEFLGTFLIVVIPVLASAASSAVGAEAPLVIGALSSGLPVMAAIAAFGAVSGAHLNPAVTLAFAVIGKIVPSKAAGYVIAQLAGALLAAGVAALLLGAGPGSHVPAPSMDAGRALGLEAVAAFCLMLVIMGAATDKRVHPAVPALAIGLAVCSLVMAIGPATGCSMNPARSFGPAVFAGGQALASLWIYFAGPAVGTVLAALAYQAVRSDGEAGPG